MSVDLSFYYKVSERVKEVQNQVIELSGERLVLIRKRRYTNLIKVSR